MNIVQLTESQLAKFLLLVDKEEIRDVLGRYGFSFDTRDWDMHAALFTDEVEMDFSASIGPGLVKTTPEEWVKGVKPFFESLPGSQHLGIAMRIEVDENEAFAVTTLHAQHYLPNNGKGSDVQKMVGFYDVWLKRTDSGWKIRKMVQHISWNEGNWYIFEKAAGLSK